MTWSWTTGNIRFALAGRASGRWALDYMVTASSQGRVARGWVRSWRAGAGRVVVDCLDFDDPPPWLWAALARAAGRQGEALARPSGAARVPTLSVVLGDEVLAALGAVLARDYRRRLVQVLAQIEAGEALPADYTSFWFAELCREAEVCPDEQPSPRELVEAYRLVEAQASLEVREHAARVRRRARLERRARELARWNAWVSENLAGLVETSVFPLAPVQRSGGAPVTFATSRHDQAVTYEPLALKDGTPAGFVERAGDREVAYVPPALAERWYSERWRSERGGACALWVLGALLRSVGVGAWEDDYLRWIARREGVARLVELARAAAPVEVSWRQVVLAALASKAYRIPLSCHDGETPVVGYGVPDLGPASHVPLEGERREQYLRLYGWVELGDEARGPWPRPEDLADHQREQRRLVAGAWIELLSEEGGERPC